MNTNKTFYITYYARTHNGIKLEKGKTHNKTSKAR